MKSRRKQEGARLLHFLPSRMTQAAIVDAGMADSSQSRFIISCLSKGASNLFHPTSVREKGRQHDWIWTEILKDMMKAFDTSEWAYFVIEIEEKATGREGH